MLGLLGTFVTVRKSGIGLHTVKNLRLLVLSETETVTHAYIAGSVTVSRCHGGVGQRHDKLTSFPGFSPTRPYGARDISISTR